MKTLIIDNYDSFTYNLYQYIGELGGSPEVHRNDKLTLNEVKRNNFSHIVISPGPGNPTDPKFFGICSDVILTFGKIIPTLGVCLGHQGIIACFGGKIIRAKEVKHGKKSLITHIGRGIFQNVKSPLYGMRYHSLIGEKESIPAVLQITATTVDSEIVMGVMHKKNPIFGIQFHPESIGTKEGKKILNNFLSIEVAPQRGATS